VDHVIAALQARFASVAFDAPVPPVLVAGGPTSLRRVLSNVLVNACEGNGVRGASTVEITVRCEDATVVIDIRDDGPGIAAHVLSTVPAAVSTKPAGLGLGIGVVDGVVRASGGTVEWRNVDRGACVAIALRASL
jgi:C4-dicarboxylate-specific signal transduction histidine kinase